MIFDIGPRLFRLIFQRALLSGQLRQDIVDTDQTFLLFGQSGKRLVLAFFKFDNSCCLIKQLSSILRLPA